MTLIFKICSCQRTFVDQLTTRQPLLVVSTLALYHYGFFDVNTFFKKISKFSTFFLKNFLMPGASRRVFAKWLKICRIFNKNKGVFFDTFQKFFCMRPYFLPPLIKQKCWFFTFARYLLPTSSLSPL